MRDAGPFRQWLGQAVLKRRIRHELEHLGREPWAGVGGDGYSLQDKQDVVRGRDVGEPVARRVRTYPVKLGFYPLLSQVAVEHELCGVVALLDHERRALAQGHGVAGGVADRKSTRLNSS